MSVEDSEVIDLIGHDRNGTVVLIMVEGREWDGSKERLLELQDKLNAYAAFALDGELIERHPEFVGKAVRIELRCATLPDQTTAEFIRNAAKLLEDVGLTLKVQQIRNKPTG